MFKFAEFEADNAVGANPRLCSPITRLNPESTTTDIIDSFSAKLKRLSAGKQEVQKVLVVDKS
jgi:hypothetical protein